MPKVPIPFIAVAAGLLLVGATAFAITAQAQDTVFAARAGDDVTVECASEDGATVLLDGTASTAAENDTLSRYEWREGDRLLGTAAKLNLTFPRGVHVVTLTVTNATNDTRSDNLTVTVEDTTAPDLEATLVGDALLWPPNHKMHDLRVDVDASDACGDVEWVLESATSDEDDDGLGDGHTTGDLAGADVGEQDTSFSMRAERAGPGDGREYTLVYKATDEAGNVARASVVVLVPHDQGA